MPFNQFEQSVGGITSDASALDHGDDGEQHRNCKTWLCQGTVLQPVADQITEGQYLKGLKKGLILATLLTSVLSSEKTNFYGATNSFNMNEAGETAVNALLGIALGLVAHKAGYMTNEIYNTFCAHYRRRNCRLDTPYDLMLEQIEIVDKKQSRRPEYSCESHYNLGRGYWGANSIGWFLWLARGTALEPMAQRFNDKDYSNFFSQSMIIPSFLACVLTAVKTNCMGLTGEIDNEAESMALEVLAGVGSGVLIQKVSSILSECCQTFFSDDYDQNSVYTGTDTYSNLNSEELLSCPSVGNGMS